MSPFGIIHHDLINLLFIHILSDFHHFHHFPFSFPHQHFGICAEAGQNMTLSTKRLRPKLLIIFHVVTELTTVK